MRTPFLRPVGAHDPKLGDVHRELIAGARVAQLAWVVDAAATDVPEDREGAGRITGGVRP